MQCSQKAYCSGERGQIRKGMYFAYRSERFEVEFLHCTLFCRQAKRKRPIGRLRIKWLALFSAPPHPKDEHEACREEELGNSAANAADSVPFVPGGTPCCVASSQPAHKEEISELSENPHLHAQKHCCSYDIEVQTLASIKIQTAFRGFLVSCSFALLVSEQHISYFHPVLVTLSFLKWYRNKGKGTKTCREFRIQVQIRILQEWQRKSSRKDNSDD